MAEDFAGYISQERDRLHREREEVFNQQREQEEKLAEINKELRAIDAYESAKTGKATPAAGGQRKRAMRRGSRREGLLALIRENPIGLSRGEILTKMGLKGDKAGEMSISNALTALTKGNQVTRDGGKYRPAA